MNSSQMHSLLTYVNQRYPQFRKGIAEAMQVDLERFDRIAETSLGWLIKARGPEAIERSVDDFVQFTTSVNLAQVRYERTGSYEHSSFAEVYRDHYSQDDQMQGYLWGIFLTNFLWAHHMEITLQYHDRFLGTLQDDARIVEIAPGHGAWGVAALDHLPGAQLRGYDISPSSIQIATAVAQAAGVQDQASYELRDALDLGQMEADSADACICCVLVEHLEHPDELFGIISHLLRTGGRAFVTGALTAAQVDHIYEFRQESELILLAEAQGLRVLESLSVNPKRLLPKARFVPRSMSLVLHKPIVGGTL